jgi:predicted O-methyltransferase YrrM
MQREAKRLGETMVTFVRHVAADLVRPQRGFPLIREWLGINYRWMSQRPACPTQEFFDLYPAARDLIVPMDVQFNYWSITPLELYYLSCIALLRRPHRIFEFGTYTGGTTLQLARMCPDSAVWTIDLTPDPTGKGEFITGSRFHGTVQERQITQLYGDSRAFDPRPLAHSIDLVFVDGGHDAECAWSDTKMALHLVAPGGIIWWDDYTNQPGVKQAVEHLLNRYPITHIARTKQALLDTAPGPSHRLLKAP